MILTVTLNPSVDEEYILDELHLGSWARAKSTLRMPGGRGVNVSLLLNHMDYSSVAMGFLAGFNGDYILDALRRADVTTNFVHIQGETRTNVYIALENRENEEGTSIFERGPSVSEEEQKRFLMNYRRMINRASAVVIGGSLPSGMPKDFYRTLAFMAREAGLPVYIDAYGSPFLMALEARPRVAKIPSTRIERIIGKNVSGFEDYLSAARKVHEMGVPWSVVSYGTYSDIFVTPEGAYLASVDQAEQDRSKSLFASRDALLAGLVIADAEDMSVENMIRFAMACAVESCSHMDKTLGGRKAVEACFSCVKIEKLD